MQYYCKDSNCTQKVQFFPVSCTHIVHSILRFRNYRYLRLIINVFPAKMLMVL